MDKKISLIIPVFNEQDTLPFLYAELCKTIDQCTSLYLWEIIFVNDGSKDSSWEIITKLSQEDTRVKGVTFSRNFGHQMALAAGYDCASGDALITLDADMQDPPSLILELLKKWEQGFYIVYARRIARNDGWLKDTVARLYYRFLHMVAEVKIPRNVGDFRLIDRKVLNVITTSHEPTRYWRGLVAWTGFKHAFVDFKRNERAAGTPGYTWAKSLKLGFDGITGFSFFPLVLAAYVGVFVVGTGTFMLAYITYDAFFFQTRYPLFKWLTTIIYIFTGVQFLLTWLVGEYIGRMYMHQKQRPLYIIEQTVGSTYEHHASPRGPIQGGDGLISNNRNTTP